MSVLAAGVWHRLRAVEYRMKYTLDERDKDWEEEKLELARRLLEGWTDAAKAMKEKLESIFSTDDPDEAGPEDRTARSQIIGDIAEELVFGDGKEKP